MDRRSKCLTFLLQTEMKGFLHLLSEPVETTVFEQKGLSYRGIYHRNVKIGVAPTARQLEIFRKIPSGETIEVSEIQEGLSRPTLLFHLRNLEEQGLLRAVKQRPKVVEVAVTPYAATLHGILRSRPHLSDLLHGSHLLVLAGLASAGPSATIQELSGTIGLHRNTVGEKLSELRRRALVQKTADGYRLADPAPEIRQLGRTFQDHLIETIVGEHRGVYPVATDGLRVVLEAERPVDGLSPTAAFRFQMEGADVLASRPQYAVTPGAGGVDLEAAYQDALRLQTPPRTLDAMDQFMHERGVGAA